jgi:hypothetical protein
MNGRIAAERLGAAYSAAPAANPTDFTPAPVHVPTASIPYLVMSAFPLQQTALHFAMFPMLCCSWGTP